MSNTKAVDFKQELTLLTQLISDLWDGTESNGIQQFIGDVFEAGLSAGRLWVTDSITFTVDEELAKDKQFEDAMDKRRSTNVNGTSFTSLYDGLCIFNMWVGSAIRDIHHGATSNPEWNYESEVNELTFNLKRAYDLSGLRPKQMPVEEQQRIMKAYEGVDSSETRVNSVAEMLTPKMAFYWAEEHGRTFTSWVVGAIYSHGIYCAKHTNTANLLNTLLPVYREYVNAPINFDNGAEILEKAKGNELVGLALNFNKPEFQSSELFKASEEAYKVRQELLANETPEQKEERENKQREKMRQMTSEILEEDDSVEDEAYRDKLKQLTADFTQYVAREQ